jgi:cold shock CspA family protein
MRFTGTLRSWNDERGFGFIAPDQGGRELFVHVSALPRDGTKPVVGEKLSFEMAKGDDGKLRAVKVYREAFGPPERRGKPSPASSRPARRSRGLVGRFASLVLIASLAAYAYHRYTNRVPPQLSELIASAPQTTTMPRDAVAPVFRCDGRQYCSQMHSCKEAKFFLKNCPGTQMDGNRDGVPCEQQWCTGPLAE